MEAFTKWFKENRNSFGVNRSGGFIVPVVFHILHDGGSEYVSKKSLDDQWVYLNQTHHWNKIQPRPFCHCLWFDTLIGDMGVEFNIGAFRPERTMHRNGIDRIMTFATNVGNNNTKLNPWPPDKYLNIWVNKALERDSSSFGTIAFSMYPVNVQTWINNDIIDGVISKIAGVNGGSIGRSTLAHEVGHWLNLKHVWGDSNEPGVSCGDDDVDVRLSLKDNREDVQRQ